jgi:hypothetical protein
VHKNADPFDEWETPQPAAAVPVSREQKKGQDIANFLNVNHVELIHIIPMLTQTC